MAIMEKSISVIVLYAKFEFFSILRILEVFFGESGYFESIV